MSPPPGGSGAPDGTQVHRTILDGPACGRHVTFGMDTASSRPETLRGEPRHAALHAPVLCPHPRRHCCSNRGSTGRVAVDGVPCRCMADCDRSGNSVRTLVTRSSGCRNDSGEVMHAPRPVGHGVHGLVVARRRPGRSESVSAAVPSRRSVRRSRPGRETPSRHRRHTAGGAVAVDDGA